MSQTNELKAELTQLVVYATGCDEATARAELIAEAWNAGEAARNIKAAAHDTWTQVVTEAERRFGANYAAMAGWYRQLLLSALLDADDRDAEIAELRASAPKLPAERGNHRCVLVQRGVKLTVDADVSDHECNLQGVWMPNGTEITQLFTGLRLKPADEVFDGESACIALELAAGEDMDCEVDEEHDSILEALALEEEMA